MKRTANTLGLVLAAALGLFACGTVVTGGGGAEGTASFSSYCDARAAACGIDAAACKADESCARALLRDDIEGALFDCLASTCDENVCFAQIEQSFTRTAKGQQFSAAHASYLAACPTGNDDVALAAWILADDALDDYLPCPSAPTCEEAAACFEAADAAHVAGCRDWL